MSSISCVPKLKRRKKKKNTHFTLWAPKILDIFWHYLEDFTILRNVKNVSKFIRIK